MGEPRIFVARADIVLPFPLTLPYPFYPPFFIPASSLSLTSSSFPHYPRLLSCLFSSPCLFEPPLPPSPPTQGPPSRSPPLLYFFAGLAPIVSRSCLPPSAIVQPFHARVHQAHGVLFVTSSALSPPPPCELYSKQIRSDPSLRRRRWRRRVAGWRSRSWTRFR
jgi:hypothetical protein